MMTRLNSLASLNLSLFITAGPLLRSKSSTYSFTHILHIRFKSKDELSAYDVHPSHISAINDYVEVIEDVIAADWESNELTGDFVPKVGSAIRVSFLRLKKGVVEEDKVRVLSLIGGIKDVFSGIDQVSFGKNISMKGTKGFKICLVEVFKGLNDLEMVDSNSELVNYQKEKVNDLIDSVVVVDYVVLPPSPEVAAARL